MLAIRPLTAGNREPTCPKRLQEPCAVNSLEQVRRPYQLAQLLLAAHRVRNGASQLNCKYGLASNRSGRKGARSGSTGAPRRGLDRGATHNTSRGMLPMGDRARTDRTLARSRGSTGFDEPGGCGGLGEGIRAGEILGVIQVQAPHPACTKQS